MNDLRRETFTLLKHYEGFRGIPYLCPAGFRSIGYGRNLETVGLSAEECKMLDCDHQGNGRDWYKNSLSTWGASILLRNDIDRAEKSMLRHIPEAPALVDRSPEAAEILLRLVFQMGAGTVLQFRNMRKALSDLDFNRAADEMKDSLWYRQSGLRSIDEVQRMRELA